MPTPNAPTGFRAGPPAGARLLGYGKSQFNFAPTLADISSNNDPTFKFARDLYYQPKPGWTNPACATMVNGVLSLNNLGGGGIGTTGNIVTQTQNSVATSLGYLVASNGFYCEWEEAISTIDPDHWEAMWLLPQEHLNGALSYVEIDVHEGGIRGLETMFSTAIFWTEPAATHVNYNSWNASNPLIDRTKFNRYGVSYDPKGMKLRYYLNDFLNFTVDTASFDHSIRPYRYYMIAGAQAHAKQLPYSMYIRNMQAWTP